MNHPLTPADFDDLVRPLIGLPVSLARRGYGSAFFLELGDPARGEAGVSIYWDWRIEDAERVLCGSSNTNPEIDDFAPHLQGLEVTAVRAEGPLPEVAVHLSGGLVLRSFVTRDGDPDWGIKLPDGTWISSEGGELRHGDGAGSAADPELAAEVEGESERTKQAAERWGAPRAEPVAGPCRTCFYYERLDASFHLLDYGVCSEPRSPFDGRVVQFNSGCPFHQEV